ncbi:tetratricopeptide repeat protein, partial [bacterium]|nr:tetratricopeptide repeat protein [bacterium]
AYHGLGLAHLAHGSYGTAVDVFLRIAALTPNDNLGVRVLLIHCYFRLKRPEDVIAVCAQCPNDMMEQVQYGKPLALFQVGQLDEAREALGKAIQALPLVAKELVKSRHRRPKQTMAGYVTHGGADQAYEYWHMEGCFWSEAPGAIEFVRECVDQHSS